MLMLILLLGCLTVFAKRAAAVWASDYFDGVGVGCVAEGELFRSFIVYYHGRAVTSTNACVSGVVAP